MNKKFYWISFLVQIGHLLQRSWFGTVCICIALLGISAPAAQAATSISGTVFEDINYGGGAGRNYATSNAAAVASGFANNLIQVPAGVRVELYNVNPGTGAATRNSTVVTNAAGLYNFAGPLVPGTYSIRAVNANANGVRSKRPGGPCAACIAVQTFRVASTGAGVDNAIADVVNEVGGRIPQTVDAADATSNLFQFNVNTGLTIFGAGTWAAGLTVQSFTTITLTAAAGAVAGVDFGFNYDTIVNTNDTGQGSLRQFIANSNTLTNANLAQQGQPAGQETSIFMIPNGQANPGQNTRITNQLAVAGANSGAAVINLASDLVITDANTRLDGGTQTTNVRATPGGAETNPGSVGTGGTIGTNNASLSVFIRPEVVVSGNGAGRRISASGAGDYIGGIAWDQMGILTTGNASMVQDNLVGMLGDGTVGTVYGANYGIQADNGTNITVRHNYVRVNNSGVRTDGGTTGLIIEQNEVANPGSLALPGAGHTLTFDGILLINNATSPVVRFNLAYNQNGGGFEYGFGACGLFTNVAVYENTFRDNGFAGSTTVASTESMGAAIYCAAAGSNAVMSFNVIANNAGPGLILMQAANYVLTRNSFYNNGRATTTSRGLGIDSVVGRNTPNPLSANDDPNRDPNGFCGVAGSCTASAFVTLNDFNDAVPAGTVGGAAGAPNPLVNFPVIERASASGGLLTLEGWARPGAVIEFFIAEPNPSGFGEGKSYIATLSEGGSSDTDASVSLYGAASVAACNVGAGATPAWTPVNGVIVGCDSTNRFRFTISLPPGVGIGVPLTSTATSNGTTSEFSNTVIVGSLDGQVAGRVFLDTGRVAGIANNGILETGEAGALPGIGGVTMRLTNCVASGGGRVVYQNGTTDAAGNYAFALPNPLGAVTEICVEETNLAADPVSTGASFVGSSGAPVAALASGVSTAALGITYRYCRNTGDGSCGTQPADSIRVQNPAQGGLYYNLNFGDVPENNWVASAIQETTPGNVVNYPHRFSALSGGSVTFGATVLATTPVFSGWSSALYLDTNCNGVINPGEPLLSGAFTLTAGQDLCIVVRHFTPPSAPFNAQQALRIDATFTWTNTAPAGPGLIQTYSRTDITIVTDKSGGGLKLVKDVCNVTVQATTGQPCNATLTGGNTLAANGFFDVSNAGQPGETLRYRVVYANPGSTPVTSVVINDATPPFTTYLSSACSGPLPQSISACAAATVPAVCSGACAISWTLTGALQSGGQGSVTFDVLITP